MNTTIDRVTTDKPNAYTNNAWQGKMYDSNLTIKDIAERVRFFLKKQYPNCKFSVTTESYSGGQAMNMRVMATDFNLFATPDIEMIPMSRDRREETLTYWQKSIDDGHYDINQFYINDDFRLNDEGKKLFNFMNACAKAFNYDDSDSQVDYFDTNFYLHMSVGKWDKAYKLITK